MNATADGLMSAELVDPFAPAPIYPMTAEVPRMRQTDRDLRRFWAKVALPDENGCMLWLGARSGKRYGSFRVGDSRVYPHRYSLQLAVGPPPVGSSDCAHSCRNKHCVAPAHLRWATHVDNEADKLRDGISNRGERCGNAKLTADQVLEMRRRYAIGGVSQRKLAAEFGISLWHVWGILKGRAWAHLAGCDEA